VATNTDATLPSPRGPLPGNGSLVAAVVSALGGRMPDDVVGKPQPALFETAAAHRRAERALVVGDRLDTDVEGAGRAGMDSLLVLTGVSSPADLLAAPAHRRPTYVAADCAALSTSDDDSRVPRWRNEMAVSGAWRVAVDGDYLLLATKGSGDSGHVAALRALASAAWVHPEWTGVRPGDAPAERAVAALRLDRFDGWRVRATSAA
jgi:hypothetical protein